MPTTCHANANHRSYSSVRPRNNTFSVPTGLLPLQYHWSSIISNILFYVTNRQSNISRPSSRSTASTSLQISSSELTSLQQPLQHRHHSRLTIRPWHAPAPAQCPVPRPSDPSSQVRLIRCDRGGDKGCHPSTSSLFAGCEMGGKPALSGANSMPSLAGELVPAFRFRNTSRLAPTEDKRSFELAGAKR